MSMTIRKGDTVQVRAGKDKDAVGRVLDVTRDARGRALKVLVEGVNQVHRHQRQTQQAQGGIVEQEAYLDASNVMLVDGGAEDRPSRIGAKTNEDGTRSRVAKRSGNTI